MFKYIIINNHIVNIKYFNLNQLKYYFPNN